ncbi:MAG: hypothetical protein Q8P81_03125 [Nanoarchaeota archaeon]|nr:hypothetical protein [Nanoarchaeota archaeon]
MVNKKKTEEKKVVGDSKKKISKRDRKENRFLKNMFILLGIVLIGILLGFLVMKEAGDFEYRGVKFSVVEFCDAKPCLKTYSTKVPVIYQGQSADYNFYLRNDPRDLDKKISFDGELQLAKKMFIDITFDRNCRGYESVAMDNFGTLMKVAGIDVESDKNQSCNYTGEDMYVLIQEGEETEIVQFGPACYNINIKECEIISGTERFMTEVFVKLNETAN